ncbi:hypothetical protein [Lignipirellula cremea]|uniref:Uncharacterized protein n=1 Tax=Lignipirellula cremea TaxID=2528010 RepID=A0A518DU61_9BACT|nr:hypothetical protein [Lignipirellula cremea]QDU95369.1 hypothetical protein Pla8534_31840 [Lignipirellula cremea]
MEPFDPADLWRFLLPGYLITVAIETPVLVLGLSRTHRLPTRLAAGFWLTACTYPVVVLVLPLLFPASWRLAFLATAETFAPVAECWMFHLACHAGRDVPRSDRIRDYVAITLANLLSFGLGELFYALGGSIV